MEVETKTLPDSLRGALRSLGYHRRDISIEAAETISPMEAGAQGCKAFFCIVELEPPYRHETMWGSWGGANMFNPGNRVDLDNTERSIPENRAFIKGELTGMDGVFAWIYVHPSNIAKYLPLPVEISERDRLVLAIHCQIKGGNYRKEYKERHSVQDSELESLSSRGFLSKNKAGIYQITTSGKNAVDSGKRIWL